MTDRSRQFTQVLERELRTLRRSRTVWVVAGGFLALTLGVALVSGTSGYVPLALALTTPLELLLPVVAVALGYRAILTDREHGAIDVFRTYPIAPGMYTVGVYCGRLAVVLATVVGALLLVAIIVPLVGPSPVGLTRTSGLDSPLYYLRFVVLTGLFAAAVLAVMVALSAVVRNARRGVVVALAFAVVFAVGLDLAIVLGLASGVVTDQSLPWYVAASPASAYRSLVLGLVVAPVSSTVSAPATPVVSLASLLSWAAVPLLVAARWVWEPTTHLRSSDENRRQGGRSHVSPQERE